MKRVVVGSFACLIALEEVEGTLKFKALFKNLLCFETAFRVRFSKVCVFRGTELLLYLQRVTFKGMNKCHHIFFCFLSFPLLRLVAMPCVVANAMSCFLRSREQDEEPLVIVFLPMQGQRFGTL